VSCGSTSVDTSNYRTELFYVANSKGNAADNTTVTMNGTVTDLAIAVLEYSGQATGTPFDKAITGNGASGTAWSTASLTPANANELCVSFAVATTAFTGTVGTGYTIAGNNGTHGQRLGRTHPRGVVCADRSVDEQRQRGMAGRASLLFRHEHHRTHQCADARLSRSRDLDELRSELHRRP
jgi:hypothetical protein